MCFFVNAEAKSCLCVAVVWLHPMLRMFDDVAAQVSWKVGEVSLKVDEVSWKVDGVSSKVDDVAFAPMGPWPGVQLQTLHEHSVWPWGWRVSQCRREV